MAPKPVHLTTGNANGVVIARAPSHYTLYLSDTGVSVFKPTSTKNPYGDCALYAYDVAPAGGVLTNPRVLNNPIGYFYDGIRASGGGWVFAGAGDGVDVVSPTDGVTLGTIRVGGGANLAVAVALGEHELWHVEGVRVRLGRDW